MADYEVSSFSRSGASGDHVNMEMYPGHNEDFAGADLSQLDTWVFDRAQVRNSHLYTH